MGAVVTMVVVLTIMEVREAKEAKLTAIMVVIITEVKEVRGVKVVTTMKVKEARAVKEVITEKKHKCCLLNNIDGISDNIFESYRINESRRIKRCTFTIAVFFHSFIAQSLIQIRDVSKYMAFPVYNTFYV